MPIGVIYLDEKGRNKFAKALVTLTIAQSVLGLILAIWALHICFNISPSLVTEKTHVNFVFSVIIIFGSHIFFHGLCGIHICQKCQHQSSKKCTRNVLWIWIFFGCNILIDIFVLATNIKVVSKYINKALTRSLEEGIERYLKDSYWKKTIDHMQVNLECCGVTNFRNWHRVSWLDENQLSMGHRLVKQLRLDENKPMFPVVPWSCCNIYYPLQCLHDPFQQIESAYLWKEDPAIVENSIYLKGCLAILKEPVERAFAGFIVVTIFIFIFMIFAIFVARVLYTSSRNNLMLQNDQGIAPGWIFGRGDCKWAYGPTLDQMMAPLVATSSVSSNLESKSSRKSARVSNSTNTIRTKRKFSRQARSTKETKSEEDQVSSTEERALMLR
ncbi:hypothetical protein FQA39_LY14126 [Lamprigera yunnana]|nr:hypothetical protein FQA39_LY14126 [Lamprigera yunnana]